MSAQGTLGRRLMINQKCVLCTTLCEWGSAVSCYHRTMTSLTEWGLVSLFPPSSLHLYLLPQKLLSSLNMIYSSQFVIFIHTIFPTVISQFH